MKNAAKFSRRAARKAKAGAGRVKRAVSRRLAPQSRIASRDSLHTYWRKSQRLDDQTGIEPAASNAGVLTMFENAYPKLSTDAKILEVGCGDGRNLAYLHDNGFTNLEGIEINPHAIKRLRETYPQLEDVTIHEGSAEDILPTLADDQFSAAMTVATLQHIHPASVEVFDNLVRVASDIFVIEGPARSGKYQHPHDYEELFRARGMTMRSTRPMAAIPGAGETFGAYVGRQYRRMEAQATLHEFWRQPTPPGNDPHDYIGVSGRSVALLELISDLPKDSRILEVGCNVGRNIAHLYDNGYTGVEGIEINPHAVELLRKTFPQLADTDVHIGPAGELLPKFADDEFDLVYTMAVLEHIHPDESSVFDDMARIGKHVLAIEPKGRLSHRQFPHDVPKEFGDRGLTMVSETPMGDFPSNANDKTIHAFYAYRFARPDGWTHHQAMKHLT